MKSDRDKLRPHAELRAALGPGDRGPAVLDELGWTDGTRLRAYGRRGPCVILLHGGPAATGGRGMETIGRRLSACFRVLEPWQRGSGREPLTVARHIRDLHALVQQQGERPVLVGASWGAMLALAYAADHPDCAGPIVLVGCGTFDPASFAELKRRLDARKREPRPPYSREDLEFFALLTRWLKGRSQGLAAGPPSP